MASLTATLEVLEMVRHFKIGFVDAETHSEPLNSRTLDDVAATVSSDTYAVQSYKILQGTARVENTQVSVYSAEFAESPRLFLGGMLYTVEQVRTMPDAERMPNALFRMQLDDLLIKTHLGNWQPFYKGEKIYLPK